MQNEERNIAWLHPYTKCLPVAAAAAGVEMPPSSALASSCGSLKRRSRTCPSSRVRFHRRTSKRPCLPRRTEVKAAVPPAVNKGESQQVTESEDWASEIPLEPLTRNCTSMRPASMLICDASERRRWSACALLSKPQSEQQQQQRLTDPLTRLNSPTRGGILTLSPRKS